MHPITPWLAFDAAHVRRCTWALLALVVLVTTFRATLAPRWRKPAAPTTPVAGAVAAGGRWRRHAAASSRPISASPKVQARAEESSGALDHVVTLIAAAEAEPSAEACERLSQEIERCVADMDPSQVVPALPFEALNSLWGNALVADWARRDRRGAGGWLASHPGADMAQAVALVRGWVGENPSELGEYIGRLPAGRWKAEVLKAATWEAVACDRMDAAIAWAKQLDGADDRDGLLVPALCVSRATLAAGAGTPDP